MKYIPKLLFLFCTFSIAHTQVTIGSDEPSLPGALLQIKNRTGITNGDANASQGLGMPRIKLTDKNNLFPMFANGADEYTGVNKTTEDAKHIGLMVYHTDKCSMMGKGLYVWDGSSWNKLGKGEIPSGIALDKNYFDLPSGKDNRLLTEQALNITWTGIAPIWSVAASAPLKGVLFTSNPLAPSFTGSPTVLMIKPDPMTEPAFADPWKSRESILTFASTNDCGGTEIVTLNQTNHALQVNNSFIDTTLPIINNIAPKDFIVKGNVQWNAMVNDPSGILASTTPMMGGTELKDGTTNITSFSYNPKNDMGTKYGTATIVFSDKNIAAPRFNDITTSVMSCLGTISVANQHKEAKITINRTKFDVPSGHDLRDINTAQNLNISWNPIGKSLTYTSTNKYKGDVSLNPAFPLSPIPSTANPSNITLKALQMPFADITATNPWASRETEFAFTAIDDCGITKQQTVIINQTNKAILINGKSNPDQVDITTDGSYTASVESNAQWKLASIVPTINSAVTSNDLNLTKGTEKNDGTAVTNILNYSVTTGSGYARYNYLTFEDANLPKRFNDVTLNVAQCSGYSDLTMQQYKNIWEGLYGLKVSDEPDSSGNIIKNTNKVQWHYDQDNNIFFSADFGPAGRWMTTNLAATKFANGMAITPSFATNVKPNYGYPNVTRNTDPLDRTQYELRERLGVLYNWYAAINVGDGTNGTTPDPGNVDQKGDVHGSIQGVRPNGWVLPTYKDWVDVITEVKENPTKYSINNDDTRSPFKDVCEIYDSGKGKSLPVLDGGFSLLIAGRAASGENGEYGINAYIWTSSSVNYSNAYGVKVPTRSNTIGMPNSFTNRAHFFSVRCKKL